MLILGMFCQIIKSLFRKYTISLHPLYHPFSCYIKEISHLRKMADVVSSETQFETDTMSPLANTSVGTIIKTQNKNVIFLIVYPPM